MARLDYYYITKKTGKDNGPRVFVYFHAEEWRYRNMKMHGIEPHQRPFIWRTMTDLEVEEEKPNYRMRAQIYRDAVGLLQDEWKVSEDPEFCFRLEKELMKLELKRTEMLPLTPEQRIYQKEGQLNLFEDEARD